MNSWHVGVAAEAMVAAQFARYGYDVSVQYGADQPEYEIADRAEKELPDKKQLILVYCRAVEEAKSQPRSL